MIVQVFLFYHYYQCNELRVQCRFFSHPPWGEYVPAAMDKCEVEEEEEEVFRRLGESEN